MNILGVGCPEPPGELFDRLPSKLAVEVKGELVELVELVGKQEVAGWFDQFVQSRNFLGMERMILEGYPWSLGEIKTVLTYFIYFCLGV